MEKSRYTLKRLLKTGLLGIALSVVVVSAFAQEVAPFKKTKEKPGLTMRSWMPPAQELRLTSAGLLGHGIATPAAKHHIFYNSSLTSPHLRLTEDDKDYTRIVMEGDLYPGIEWQMNAIVDGASEFSNLGFYYKDSGLTTNRLLITGDGKVGINTPEPLYRLDVRGTDNTTNGGDLQLATPDQTNFLRLFGGRQGDPHPFIAFHELDTFHLVTTAADWSTYTRRMTILPNGFMGLGTDLPSAELDIMSGSTDDGVKLQLSNSDTSHFLRLYSGQLNVPHPIMYWNQGDTMEIGMASPDESFYQRFLTLNGKTIGVHNTGQSVFIGENAGKDDDGTANQNVAIGFDALTTDQAGSFNTALGVNALMMSNGAFDNTALGHRTLEQNIEGSSNVAVGKSALFSNQDGNDNTALGRSAMVAHTTGASNVAIGRNAMIDHLSGDNNTALGRSALFKNLTGSGNIAIGYQAGFFELGSNKLYIDNSSTTAPLIYGDFATNLLRANGELEVTGDLEVTGNAFFVDQSLRRAGIGTTAPIVKLHVKDPGFTHITVESGAGLDAVIQLTDDASQGADHQWTMRNDGSQGHRFQWRYNNQSKMVLATDGRLALGTTTPATGYLLSVNGKIIAEELRIQLDGSWPDYVFTDDYQLMPLEELEASINRHGHLPGIPKAEVIDNEGLDTGEMQRKMMEKIEELTLYVIELKKENVAMREEMNSIKKNNQ
jgi:hypothetical protein